MGEELEHVIDKNVVRPNYIGLSGEECLTPAFWCRLHQVWLSDKDVIKKKCLEKPTFDMIGTYTCHCIELKNKDYLKDETVISKLDKLKIL